MVTERAGSGESTAAAAHERKRLLVTEETGPNKSGSTRLDIIAAAARAFAAKPYSLVNLDDILAQADVTKSAVYTHFRSNNALAAGIAEHRAVPTNRRPSSATSRQPGYWPCQASPTPNAWSISAASSDAGLRSRSRIPRHQAMAIYALPNKLNAID